MRQVEQGREEGRRHQQDRQARGAEALVRHHRARYEGGGPGAPLDRHEGGERDRRQGEQADHPRVAEAPVVDLVEGDEQGNETDRDRRDAGIVDPLLAGVRLCHLDQAIGDQHREGRDRHVEKEDPAPAERVGEHAADQRPDRVAEAGGADDDPARQPRLVFGQQRVGHAQDRRPHQGAADPHQGPSRDQPGLALGRSAQRRHRGEDRGSEEEGVAAAEHVGQPPTGDDHHPEGECVGVDHPLDRVDVGVEVLLHRRQGDVDRGEVVGDHHHGDAHREEGKPSRARYRG